MSKNKIKELLFSAITNGIVVDGKYIEQVSACCLDGEYLVVNLHTDTCYEMNEYGKVWKIKDKE